MNIESELRIGDAERDEAITALAQHFAAGRITQEEYDERSSLALKARTRGQLRPLFADLPGADAGASARPTPVDPPKQERSREWARRLPLVPILLVLIGLSILAHFPFFLLVIVGWFFLAGPGHRHHRAAHQRPYHERTYHRHGSSQGAGRRW